MASSDPPSPTAPAIATTPSTSTTSKKKKKKRKKSSSNSNALSADDHLLTSCSSSNHAILHSKLSLKKRLQLKKTARQTPWYDIHELLDTGRGLLLALKLFPNPQQQQHNQHCDEPLSNMTPAGLTQEEYTQLQNALQRVALWRGRSDRGGRLSHAVDMTAGLAGVLLMDAEKTTTCPTSSREVPPLVNNEQQQQPQHFQQQQHSQTNLITLYQLRNTYSTLLLRSVNGLADTFRHQKKSAMLSVSHCCALAGLPLWIVDVRHDASHNELPSLGVCRIGALESLRFWKGRYWDGLVENVWGELLDNSSSRNEGVGSGGAPVLMMNSSNDGDYQGGICTLAMDCLVRYQKAAMVEEKERELLLEQQQQNKVLKKETRRETRMQQHQQQHSEQKQASEEVKLEEQQQEQHQNNTGRNQPGEDDDDVIMLPSKEEITSKNNRKRAAEETPYQQIINTCPNPFWILDDGDKPKKKKKKKSSKSEEVDKNGGGDITNAEAEKEPTNEENNSGDKANLSMADTAINTNSVRSQDNPPPSSRDCAAEFLRTIPIDIAFSMALRFLIWGRSSVDANVSNAVGNVGNDNVEDWLGPALLPCPSSSMPTEQIHMDALFDQMRTMHDPLLVAMANGYPGFVSALFVHLVDSILCLDEGISNFTQDDLNDGDEYLKQLLFNIEFLSMWVHYILSREFHMHVDRSVAIYVPEILSPSPASQLETKDMTQWIQGLSSPSPALKSLLLPQQEQQPLLDKQAQNQQLQPIDLKKKGRKRWTAAELDFMRSPLPLSFLKGTGVPLNSVCDKLVMNQHGEFVVNLVHFLEGILGEERVVFMGIYNDSNEPSSSADDDPIDSQEPAEKAMEITDPDANEPIDVETDKETCKESSKEERIQSFEASTVLSLEDLEGMLDNDDNSGDKDMPSHDNVESPSSDIMDNACTDETVHASSPQTCTASANVALTPWTLCKAWDACAIGTMPGYPA